MLLASVRNHPGFVRSVTEQLGPRQWHLPTIINFAHREDTYHQANIGYVWSIRIVPQGINPLVAILRDRD